MTKTITAKEAQASYASVIEQVKVTGEPLIIEQDGKPFAVVMRYAEYQELATLRENEKKKSWLEEQHRILAQEQAAFERMKPELLKTHKGKFVAIHDGKLVDSDADEETLVERVYSKFGYHTILITEVTLTPRVYHINSPSLSPQ